MIFAGLLLAGAAAYYLAGPKPRARLIETSGVVPTTTSTAPPATTTTTVSPPAPEGVVPVVVSSWDLLAQCITGGDWSALNGGLRILPQVWRAYGGSGFAGEHPREDQIAVAEVIRATTGDYRVWASTGCPIRLGL